MIQEYLFTGKDHRSAVEQYTIDACERKIHNVDNSECWIVTFSKSGENESSAKILSSVHSYVANNFHPTVLSNGSSAYYNKALYPYFNEFERKLRKLLYLKSVLSSDAKDCELIKDLESKDFGEIFALLFSDAQFVKDTKSSVNSKTWQFTKAEILEIIQKLPENTVWDNLIGKDAVPLLRSDFLKVKSYRNDVMHAHSMDTSKYNDASKLIKKINQQIDTEIDGIIRTREEAPNEIVKNFNGVLRNALGDMDILQSVKHWSDQMGMLQSSLPIIKSEIIIPELTTFSRIIDSSDYRVAQQLASFPQWESVRQNIQEISKIYADISPALTEIQQITASVQQSIPYELLKSENLLQATQLDPAVFKISQKMSQKVKETIRGDIDNGQNEIGNT